MNDDTALPPLAPLPSHDEIARKIANRWADRKAAAGGQKPDGCPMDNNANGDFFDLWVRPVGAVLP